MLFPAEGVDPDGKKKEQHENENENDDLDAIMLGEKIDEEKGAEGVAVTTTRKQKMRRLCPLRRAIHFDHQASIGGVDEPRWRNG